MEDVEIDHVKNVEEHVKIWEKIKDKEFGGFHVGVCSQITSSLVHMNRSDLMELFMAELGKDRVEECKNNEKFLRAIIAFKLKLREFNDVYNLLRDGNFTSTNGLLALWDESHYREKEQQIGKCLTPLIRYRIRQKYPPPASICPGGRRPSSKLPPPAILSLKQWLSNHAESPYPTQAEKEFLADDTHLSLYQVKTWFANARRRLRGRRKEETVKRILLEKAISLNDDSRATAIENHHPQASISDEASEKLSNKYVPRSQQERDLIVGNQEMQNNVAKKARVDDQITTIAIAGQRNPDTGPVQCSSVDNTHVRRPIKGEPFWPQVAVASKNLLDNGASIPFAWPAQSMPNDQPEMNASRSLQALAGMCDGLTPRPYFPVDHSRMPGSQRVSAHSNSYADAGQCFKANATEPYLDNPYGIKPSSKETALWQPFKSTENLRSHLPDIGRVHGEHIQSNPQSTAHVPPQGSQKKSTPVQIRPFEDPYPSHRQNVQHFQEGANVPVKDLCPSSYGEIPVYRRRKDGHPCIIPFPYFSPPPVLPYRFPVSPVSGIPLPSPYLAPNAKDRAFCEPLLTNTVSTGAFSPLFSPLSTANDINMGSDIFYLPLMSNGHSDHGIDVPFPRFSRELTPPEDNTTEAARVLLDLSKKRSLHSFLPSYRE